MSQILWDQSGEKTYETGIDHGVLYQIVNGEYVNGVAWNGLTTVTETPDGAEEQPQYADNIKYLSLFSAETLGVTIEAFTYPDEFEQNDGSAEPVAGLAITAQQRKPFGMHYRSKFGNDTEGDDYGYKLHLLYGATAAPSEKAFATINDSPAPIALSWDTTTVPVAVSGTNPVTGKPYKPTSLIVINSTKVDADALAALEAILFGSEGVDPRLPLPDEVIALFSGTVVEVAPVAPTYDPETHTITIPDVAGVVYKIGGVVQAAGPVVITGDTVVTAEPADGYKFPAVTDDDWFYDYTA